MITVFWNMTQCGLVDTDGFLGSSKMLVSARIYEPPDVTSPNAHCEKFKFHLKFEVVCTVHHPTICI